MAQTPISAVDLVTWPRHRYPLLAKSLGGSSRKAGFRCELSKEACRTCHDYMAQVEIGSNNADGLLIKRRKSKYFFNV